MKSAALVFLVICLGLPEKGHSSSLPENYVQLAQALAEPLFPTFEAAYNQKFTYESECIYVSGILSALANPPQGPELTKLWNQVAPGASECAEVLNRLGEVSGGTPDSLAKMVSLIGKVNPRGDAVGKFPPGQEAWEKSVEFRRKVIAETDPAKLREHYRDARFRMRQAAKALKKTADVFQNTTVRRPGFTGMLLTESNGGIVVESVEASSPAQTAGIKAGDQLLMVDGKSVAGKKVAEAVAMVRGIEGTTVELQLAKAGRVSLRRSLIKGVSPFTPAYHYSFNGTFDGDALSLKNETGSTLTHCTLLVHCEDDKTFMCHTHYVPEWKTGTVLNAEYLQGSDFHPWENFETANIVKVWLVSDQLSEEFEVSYSSEVRDRDIKNYCDQVKMTLSSLSKESAGDAGVAISFAGLPRLQPSKILVTLVQGKGTTALKKTVSWDGFVWQPDTVKRFRSEHFNQLAPDSYIIELNFPGSNYQARFLWDKSKPSP